MARAFIASVPLAVVLVAALVVPLAVLPGSFGFDSWPSSRGKRVTERQVRLAPPPVVAVRVRPSRAPEPTRSAVASAAPTHAVRPAAGTPAPARPTVVAQVTTPAQRHSNAAPHSPAHTSTPGRPAHQPSEPVQQPQQPSSEPEPAPEQVAGRDVPVARQDPAAHAPAPPPPSPVVEVPAPEPGHFVRESAVPCEGHGGGHHGRWGDDQGDDEQD